VDEDPESPGLERDLFAGPRANPGDFDDVVVASQFVPEGALFLDPFEHGEFFGIPRPMPASFQPG